MRLYIRKLALCAFQLYAAYVPEKDCYDLGLMVRFFLLKPIKRKESLCRCAQLWQRVSAGLCSHFISAILFFPLLVCCLSFHEKMQEYVSF